MKSILIKTLKAIAIIFGIISIIGMFTSNFLIGLSLLTLLGIFPFLLALFFEKGTKFKKQFIIGSVIAFSISIICFAITAPQHSDKKNYDSKIVNKKANNSTPKRTTVFKRTYLLKNVNEFKTNFNSYSNKLDLPYRLTNIDFKKGDVNDVISVMLDSHIGITGEVNKKNKTLDYLLINASPDGSENTSADIIIAVGQIISAVDITINKDQKGNIISKIINPDKGESGDSILINDNLYKGSYSDILGFLFTISPKF